MPRATHALFHWREVPPAPLVRFSTTSTTYEGGPPRPEGLPCATVIGSIWLAPQGGLDTRGGARDVTGRRAQPRRLAWSRSSLEGWSKSPRGCPRCAPTFLLRREPARVPQTPKCGPPWWLKSHRLKQGKHAARTQTAKRTLASGGSINMRERNGKPPRGCVGDRVCRAGAAGCGGHSSGCGRGTVHWALYTAAWDRRVAGARVLRRGTRGATRSRMGPLQCGSVNGKRGVRAQVRERAGGGARWMLPLCAGGWGAGDADKRTRATGADPWWRPPRGP